MSEVKQEGDFKIKSKKKSPKKLGNQSNEPIKVNIDEVKENITEDTAKVIIPEVKKESEAQEEVVVVGETKTEEQAQDGLIEVIEENEDNAEPVIEKQAQPVVDQRVLPENIEKLVSFMEDTGGTVEDYVRLNADYSSIDD